MKRIIGYLTRFLQKDFHLQIYLTTILFLSIVIILNYQFDFEDSIVDLQRKKWWGWPTYWAYFAIPYFFILGLYRLYLPNFKPSQRFWLKAIFAITLLSFKSWFFFHHSLPSAIGSPENRYVLSKITTSMVKVLIYVVGLVFFYKFFEVGNKNWYGLAKKENHWKIFATMLLFMLPLLLFASFQEDFLASYPRLKPAIVKGDYWKWFAFYEPFYLGEFITLEWFFRGFLVVGMVKLIGHRAVLPMATLYCIFHFGKPMGECISSFFGGYILGVIAYYSRSVWGGIIVHMGIAFLMDLFAILSHFVWKP